MDLYLNGLGLCVVLGTVMRWTLFRSVAHERGRFALLYPNLCVLLIQVICGSVIDGLLHQTEGIGLVMVTLATVEASVWWLLMAPDKSKRSR